MTRPAFISPVDARAFIDQMFIVSKDNPQVYHTVGVWLGTLLAQLVTERCEQDDAFALEAANALHTLIEGGEVRNV